MSPRILVVEDDSTLRFLIADALSILHAKVTECGTADDALQVLQKVMQTPETDGSIDLVLTDIRMPGQLDGYELAQIIWTKWPNLPVIMMSGHRLVSAEVMPTHSGFIAKPWTLDQLFDAVGKRLQQAARNGSMAGDGNGVAMHGATTLPAMLIKGYLSQ